MRSKETDRIGGGCDLAVKLRRVKGKSLSFSGVHRVTRTHFEYIGDLYKVLDHQASITDQGWANFGKCSQEMCKCG